MASKTTWYCSSCNKELHGHSEDSFSLKCSHRLCKHCISMCVVNDRCTRCPACQRFSAMHSNKDYTFSFTGRSYSQRRPDFTSPPPQGMCRTSTLSQRRFRVSSRGPIPSTIEGFIEDSADCCNEHFERCQKLRDAISQDLDIHDYLRKDVIKEKKQLQAMENELKKVKSKVDRILNCLESRIDRLKSGDRRVEEKQKQLRAFHLKSKLVRNHDQAMNLIDQDPYIEVDAMLKELDSTLEKQRPMIQDLQQAFEAQTNKLNIIRSIIEQPSEGEAKIDEFVEQAQDDLYIKPDAALYLNMSSIAPTARIASPTTPCPLAPPIPESKTIEITVADLLRMTDYMRRLILQGNIFVAQNHRKGQRFARLFISPSDELLMGHLQEIALPPSVHILQYSDVMEQREPSSQMAFLELSTQHSELGRLYINLSSNGLRSRQFHLLCTGEMGPSYAGTKLLEVDNKGHCKEEFVRCGDYEHNDGTAGKFILPLFVKDQEIENVTPCSAGTVSGLAGQDSKIGAQFIIYTKYDQRRKPGLSFGKIEKGMAVLRDAISHNENIGDIFIKECGIVLWKLDSRTQTLVLK